MRIARLGVGVIVGLWLLAGTVQAATLNLSWTNNSTVQTGVDIERCLGAGCSNFVKISAVAGTISVAVDTTVAENQTACYRVRGTQGTVVSGYSNTACGTTGINSPTGLTVTVP